MRAGNLTSALRFQRLLVTSKAHVLSLEKLQVYFLSRVIKIYNGKRGI